MNKYKRGDCYNYILGMFIDIDTNLSTDLTFKDEGEVQYGSIKIL